MPDLQDLFDTDPLNLTKEDRSQIIEHYRKMRQVYMAGGKSKPKVENPKVQLDLDIKLDDLGV